MSTTTSVSNSFGTRPGYSEDSCLGLAHLISEEFPLTFSVTGSPVTHLVSTLDEISGGHHYVLNEKSAVEQAFGASQAGQRCCVIMKHNGLGCALDSLANAGLHTIGGALIVIVGDDPGAVSSTSAVDSRQLAEAAKIPLIEPSLAADCTVVLDAAIGLSERHHTPVIVRVSNALHEPCSRVGVSDWLHGAPSASIGPQNAPHGHDRDAIAFGLTKGGRVQYQHTVTLPRFYASSAPIASYSRCDSEGCNKGIVAFGAAARYCEIPGTCRLVVRRSGPLPATVVNFVERHSEVMIVEESVPHLEQQIRMATPHTASTIRGRLSGHLPESGPLSREVVDLAVRCGAQVDPAIPEVKGTKVQPPGDHHVLYSSLGAIRRDGTFVAADVGSAVRLCYPPYNAADASLTLGSAGAVAVGAARAGRDAVGVLGDFALLHSGLEAVLDAAANQVDVVFVVLVNGIQAKTGGQPVPAVDLAGLLRACGVRTIDRWRLDDLDEADTRARISSLIETKGPSVALVMSGAAAGAEAYRW